MLRDGASRAPRPLYLLGYICDQPYFLIVVWTWRRSPTCLHWSSPVGFCCILLPLLLVQVVTVFLDYNQFPPQWQIAKPSQTFETIKDNTGRQATQYCQDPPLSRQVWVRRQNPQQIG